MGAPGFDDAPMCRPGRALRKKELTLIYPYYENPSFLNCQIENWSKYPQDVLDRITVIVVDDGSPRSPARAALRNPDELPFAFRLFRIDVDVRWNWLAARNIGLHHAKDDWCLLTDMDHVLSPHAALDIIESEHDGNTIYRFTRRECTGELIHPHPNSMLMTRSMFWRVGGYDETLSGHYGTDGDWRRRCAATAQIRTLPTELIRWEHVGDSSTTDYQRKQPMDANKRKLLAQRRPGWRPKTLSFPYHEVEL